MNARMEQIKTRLDATTGGTWGVDKSVANLVVVDDDNLIAQCPDELDARFVADAREDVGYLLNKLSVIEVICRLRLDDDSDLDKALARAIADLIDAEPVLEGAEQ